MTKTNKNISAKKALKMSWMALAFSIIFGGVGLTDSGSEDGQFLIIFGVVSFIGGIAGILYFRKKVAEQLQEKMSSMLYELIKEKNGRVSVIDFAMKANIEPEKSREIIESMSIQLNAATEIDENGKIIYLF